MTRLVNGTVVLRNATRDDVDQLALWWADGRIMAHAGFPNGIQTDKVRLAHEIDIQNQVENAADVRWILEENGTPIGEMSHHPVFPGVFIIGIKICAENSRGQGIGSKAIQLLLMHLFDTLHADKVILDTNLNNTGAQRFYERLGFTRLRVNENHWKDQLGRWQSSVDYEMERDTFFNR